MSSPTRVAEPWLLLPRLMPIHPQSLLTDPKPQVDRAKIETQTTHFGKRRKSLSSTGSAGDKNLEGGQGCLQCVPGNTTGV